MELTKKYNPIEIPQEIKDEYPHLFYECRDCLDTGKVLAASEPDEEIIVKCHCMIVRDEDDEDDEEIPQMEGTREALNELTIRKI